MSGPRLGPALWLLVAWTAVDGAVAVYLALYGMNLLSSALLAIGLVAFLAAAAVARRVDGAMLGLILLLLASHLVFRLGIPFRAEQPTPDPLFRVFSAIALAALVAGVLHLRRSGADHWLVPALLAVTVSGLGARAAIILFDVAPPFDVPLIQEAAASALRIGTDPYLTHVYDSGYPYLPVAAVAALLGSIVGDARWAVIAGDALTIAGLMLVAVRAGAPRAVGVAAGALWAWSSGGLYIAWQGFPEPILTGFLALGAAALVGPRPHRLAAGILLGLSVATKQFAVAAPPFLLGSAKGRVAVATAAVTAALWIVPFALWHPAQFAEGAFWSHLAEPGRDYALNLLVWPSIRFEAPQALILPAAFLFGWRGSRRFSDPDETWIAGSAGLLLVAFAFNGIAFVNYYAIPLVLILILIILRSRAVGPTADSPVAPS